ncbi:PTS transporter subunit IIC [Priestia taiwanensis]|uniref:PTS sugar transporter subunit IID n=1 Tax=Priestia taiwanensis TaxID=1347902 RepID=A0A917AW00_9BACI|nr:PTS sugar transporter subunit IIC [Priestia taiwanensis]MBM7363392.1 putative membrane protein [Priestia taiwanensis]GGE77543.1 PTS sugar transporter subunit IID [Priestia taiwanensis]
MREFFNRKGVSLSPREYFITALSFMALGLFSTLIIGLILKTIGQQVGITHFVTMGEVSMSLMGAGIGVAVAYGLKAPPLVLFAALFSGTFGATLGGPAGSFVATVVAVECGKLVSKETKVDIIVTPFVTVAVGYGIALLIGSPIQTGLTGFGGMVMWATEQQPFVMGIVVAVLMGLALTAPISSAAIALMLDLNGVAAGAATVGCCAQMIGFAVSSYRENKFGGFVAIGIGTSMLQVPNIIKNPLILIPPTVAGAILGPISTMVFMMENNAAGAGMGTSGFVGQIMTVTTMGFSSSTILLIFSMHIIAPAIISLVLSEWMRKRGFIKQGDMKIEMGA